LDLSNTTIERISFMQIKKLTLNKQKKKWVVITPINSIFEELKIRVIA
jgi:hypothetical protein